MQTIYLISGSDSGAAHEAAGYRVQLLPDLIGPSIVRVDELRRTGWHPAQTDIFFTNCRHAVWHASDVISALINRGFIERAQFEGASDVADARNGDHSGPIAWIKGFATSMLAIPLDPDERTACARVLSDLEVPVGASASRTDSQPDLLGQEPAAAVAFTQHIMEVAKVIITRLFWHDLVVTQELCRAMQQLMVNDGDDAVVRLPGRYRESHSWSAASVLSARPDMARLAIPLARAGIHSLGELANLREADAYAICNPNLDAWLTMKRRLSALGLRFRAGTRQRQAPSTSTLRRGMRSGAHEISR